MTQAAKVRAVTAALIGASKLVQRRTVCKVGHAIDPVANGGTTWTYWHRWKGGNGKCLNCGKTRKETLEWVPPRSEW